LTVYDVAESSVNEIKKLGAAAASSPADLASKSQVVITMLPTHNEVLSCYTGPDGILKYVPDCFFMIGRFLFLKKVLVYFRINVFWVNRCLPMQSFDFGGKVESKNDI